MTDEPRSEPGHGTPEGYTPERPAPSEAGKPGTPGPVDDQPASGADHHGHDGDHDHEHDHDAHEHDHDASAASVEHHDSGTHMDAHTTLSDDDHGHAEARLGPVDWRAWAYALLGAGAGLVVVALFWLAIR